MKYVQPLAALTRGDLELAGGKGSNLGELVRAGFAVPDGFVITTLVYREALTKGAAPVTIPAQLVALIEQAYADLGGGAVAVRSSATAEDLPGAAFAGQQESFLNVLGTEALLEAVRGCWASLWGDRAIAYRARIGYVGEPEIAVVVQRMVDAAWAGVVFTANPVTGDRDEVVVEASPGLGEAVVAGQVTPDHVVVDAQGRLRERRRGRREVVVRPRASGGTVTAAAAPGDQPPLPAGVYRELATVGRRIRDHFGSPQDIEWAYADGQVWIVQARPLTALPPAPLHVHRARRESARICTELLPARPYPLDVTAWTVPGWFAILARMLADVAAVRVDVAAMFPEQDGVVSELLPPDPRPTLLTLATPLRVLPRVRRFRPAEWTRDPRFAAFEQQLAQFQEHDPASLTWAELIQRPRQVLEVLDAYVDLRIDYLPGFLVSVARLRLLLTMLGLSDSFWPLLQGQQTRTQDANTALDAIAAMIRGNNVSMAAFAAGGPGGDERELVEAVEHDPDFAPLAQAVSAWLAEFGHRETTSAALLSAGTWAEDPALLLGSLRALVSQPDPGRGEQPTGSAELIQRLNWRRRVRLTRSGPLIARAAAAARAALVFREDTHFHALRLRPVSRRAVLEAGQRLVAAGVLAEPDDVFHLRLEELEGLAEPSALSVTAREGLADVVRQRSARRAEYGAAPLISPKTLFPHVRRARPTALVSGAAGGGGRATGPVRVIREPTEFGRLRAGDVLVCPYTNPAWTPLFQLAAAVVADSGSFGSHAAIVAREYGIPAVMGTGDGTRVLVEGQLVEVDGDRGDVVAVD